MEIYTAQSIYSESKTFSIKVNGKKLPVLNFYNRDGVEVHYANMSIDGPVSVAITYHGKDVGKPEIRPRSYQIAHDITGNVITHELDKPRHLVYFIDDENLYFC